MPALRKRRHDSGLNLCRRHTASFGAFNNHPNDCTIRRDEYAVAGVRFAEGSPVVERFDVRESLAVGVASVTGNVEPPATVPRTGVALVEHVKVDEAPRMKGMPVGVNVPAQTVIGVSNDRRVFAVVARVKVPDDGDPATVSVEVCIQAIRPANSASAFLEVAAPVEALWVKGRTVGANMEPPAVRLFDRCKPVVVTPCLHESACVNGLALDINMERTRRIPRRSKARFVIIADKAETSRVQRRTIDGVMRAVGGDLRPTPRVYLLFSGLRMLQVWHRGCSW